MDELFRNPATYTTILLAVALFYQNWKQGSSRVSAEVVQNYKTLTEQLRDQNTQQAQDFKKQGEEHARAMEEVKSSMRTMEKNFIEKIAKLEGALQEKDSQLKMQADILANRNPELINVLGEIREFMHKINNAWQSNMVEMKSQTEILNAIAPKQEDKVL